ncbi:hypothetical protein QJS04_geneDACA003581 [Acorus gramineus]|uniref:VQ domain-containing protein n=1 Tax=Acorus gramineus TaxID=55184 RepID=A0AAV9BNE7_ACOGR|nr:hypothetical protein QJS04_geneDACA003581 [Acorus gramineus]
MDKVSVHSKIRSPKQQPTKAKKKPIKVVYISNPMRVETSPSKFRSLVQELTGQDSDVSRFENNKQVSTPSSEEEPPPPQQQQPIVLVDDDEGTSDLLRKNIEEEAFEFDLFDESFTSQMLERLCYDNHQQQQQQK